MVTISPPQLVVHHADHVRKKSSAIAIDCAFITGNFAENLIGQLPHLLDVAHLGAAIQGGRSGHAPTF